MIEPFHVDGVVYRLRVVALFRRDSLTIAAH